MSQTELAQQIMAGEVPLGGQDIPAWMDPQRQAASLWSIPSPYYFPYDAFGGAAPGIQAGGQQFNPFTGMWSYTYQSTPQGGQGGQASLQDIINAVNAFVAAQQPGTPAQAAPPAAPPAAPLLPPAAAAPGPAVPTPVLPPAPLLPTQVAPPGPGPGPAPAPSAPLGPTTALPSPGAGAPSGSSGTVPAPGELNFDLLPPGAPAFVVARPGDEQPKEVLPGQLVVRPPSGLKLGDRGGGR